MKRVRPALVVVLLGMGVVAQARVAGAAWDVRLLEPPGANESKCNGASNGLQCGYVNFTGQGSATIWYGSAGSCVDLSQGQVSWISSAANAISDDQVVISAYTQMMGRGIRYSISAHTYVDLTPPTCASAGMQGCYAGTNTQVGSGQVMMGAMLMWHGTVESVIDLTPPGWLTAGAAGCAGDWQVGNGLPSSMGMVHPFLTHGTAGSFVDLTPPGSISSAVAGCDLTTQVGSVVWPSVMQGHACLWVGTAASCIDLNPFGAASSAANACWGDTQVGTYLAASGFGHAVCWQGTPGSAEDLHQYVNDQLGTQYVKTEATGIDPLTGDIVGNAYTLSGPYLISHAVMWHAVPSDVIAVDPMIGGALRVFPNPIASGSRMSFLLPSWEPGALRLCDVSGRQVRGWSVPGGVHGFEADLSESGRPIPSGVYLLEWMGSKAGAPRHARVVVMAR